MDVLKKDNINYEIAILRALAVSLVLGYHFFPSYVPMGYLGVDIFFVISGFLMVSLIKRENTFYNFIVNRVKRLFPSLILCILFFYTLGYLTLLNDEFNILNNSSFWSVLQLQNVYELSRSGYFVDSGGFRPYLNFWSLSVEIQSYLFIFLTYCFFLKTVDAQAAIARLIIIITISILSYFLCAVFFDPFFITPLRFWEFFSGCLVFYLLKGKEVSLGYKYSIALVFLLLVLAAFLLLDISRELSTFIVVLMTCFFIMFFKARRLPKLFSVIYIYIGSVSYSLYLFHYPFIEFFKIYLGSLTVIERLCIIFVTLVFAHLTDRWFQRLLSSKKWSLNFSFLGFLTIIIMALYFYSSSNNIDRKVNHDNFEILKNTTFVLDYAEPCLIKGKRYSDERCRNADNPNPNFIILGDSLANSMSTAFDEMGRVDEWYSNYIQYGKGSCPIVLQSTDTECNKFSSDIMKKVSDIKDVPILIVAQWSLYSSSDLASLKDSIHSLTQDGRLVILSDSFPLGARPRACIDRGLFFMERSCDTPFNIANERTKAARKYIQEMLTETGVVMFDPSSYFCDEFMCKVVHGSSILYLDDSHITRQGGAYLADKSIEWWDENLQTF
ncbi:acyltransferase family protein [Vibrio aestuarianus]|uniref:acyltransferase family protein n=1 Tax=Vibrio aestuarianus TaxID=28171 RepID=UPI00237CE1B7|nr:acyltransferase family protein [Vibrio aestuarianus]MDE1230901.1 acyltransferase [Vibrio aestuarianus]